LSESDVILSLAPATSEKPAILRTPSLSPNARRKRCDGAAIYATGGASVLISLLAMLNLLRLQAPFSAAKLRQPSLAAATALRPGGLLVRAEARRQAFACRLHHTLAFDSLSARWRNPVWAKVWAH